MNKLFHLYCLYKANSRHTLHGIDDDTSARSRLIIFLCSLVQLCNSKTEGKIKKV